MYYTRILPLYHTTHHITTHHTTITTTSTTTTCYNIYHQWLLRPVHAKWTEARWLTHLDSPGAFAAEYMQYEVQPTGSVVVLSR